MLKRFHKDIYFPDKTKVYKLSHMLNKKSWSFSSHCLENLKYRAFDNAKILQYIRDSKLRPEWIFEYYILGGEIQKICYRIPYSHSDIILVVSRDKHIITVYLNSKNDNHETLNKNLYQTKEAV